ncbi:hypothetical protein E4T42_00453 [Aureobasidium subglaciale]|nr:hypothetical protein E4T38_04168 [Aureobasidium subglaciale]KAI5224614.1 hypothetical protein E4T40_04021 [Aureobasidium subglaciale]KAI5227721.1 hypothetical protein E4T41_04241 [Aureobasidium subglaciale]KAI5258670.1 hypothetical protein E4T42_00453 [Aureobasidium subglaciale]KAI5263196.1 hypothetical protein E4T46_03862 [Aureobasidium subglaciale]
MLLYRRLFPIQNFYWRWWAVFLFAIGYSVAGILTEIFDCTPVHFQWDIFAEGKCINRPAFYIANAVCNSVSDLLILALPIPIVWNLALTRKKKITLSLVFAMGSAGCIVSIIRLRSIIAYLQQGDGDLTYTITDFVVWSAIETMMSMVCTCVPTLKPLFERYFRGIFSGSTHDSKPTGQYYRTDERQIDHNRKGSNMDPFGANIELHRHKNKAQITANNVDSDTDSTNEILAHRLSTVEDHVVDDRGTSGIVVSHSYQVRTTVDS